MKKTLCCTVLFAFLLGCKSSPPQADVQELMDREAQKSQVQTEEKKVDVITASPQLGRPPACARYGSKNNFNDQRIVALQKMIQLEILKIKAIPMTLDSTQALAQLETLRRRVSYPLLSSGLRPEVVTKVLTAEAKNFIAYLELHKKSDPQAAYQIRDISQDFIPHLMDEDYWNCVEKQTDFQEEKKEESP